jgi:hypothetical protein
MTQQVLVLSEAAENSSRDGSNSLHWPPNSPQATSVHQGSLGAIWRLTGVTADNIIGSVSYCWLPSLEGSAKHLPRLIGESCTAS